MTSESEINFMLLARLSQNFETLLKNSNDSNDNCDTVINVGEEPNRKKFYVHSIILTSQSEYFREALSRKKDDDKIIFDKPNLLPKYFEIILKHLYCGTVSLNELTSSELLDLLSAANEFKLLELTKFIEYKLLTLADSWMKTDFVKTYLFIQKFPECKDIQEFCIQRVCENPEFIFMSNDFTTLSEEMLIDLLKRDDLELEEIELWKYVVQWGVHRCSDNKNRKDLNEWKDEDFKELWEIIKNPVELIRFHDFSKDDFVNVVKPYSSIFPREKFEHLVLNLDSNTNTPKRGKRVWDFSAFGKPNVFGQTKPGFITGGFGFGDSRPTQVIESTSGASGFGFGQSTQPTGFGFGTTRPSGFGSKQISQPQPSPFGGFGQPSTQPTGFGFGTTRPSGFGSKQISQPQPSPFGGFGQPSTQPTGFGFGQTTQPASSQTSLFGVARPSGFGFGQTTTQPASSQPSPFGGLGQPSTSGFGFGQTTTQPASQPSLFGQPSTKPIGFGFGQPASSQPSLFGSNSGGFGFGQTTEPTKTTQPTGFGFGQTTTQPSSGFGFGKR